MSYTIHKIALEIEGEQIIKLPEHAKILTASVQNDIPTLWYHCDPSKPLEERRIIIVGTGRPAPYFCKYIGTIFVGSYVWYLFERG